MKTKIFIVYFGLTIICFGLIWVSCSKENNSNLNIQENQTTSTISLSDKNVDELLTFYYGEYQGNSKDIWGKIWKWMKSHTGTHLFENCQGNMPCGPCSGFCAFRDSKSADLFIPVDESDNFSTEEYQDGERLFQIALFNDTIMGFSFTQSDFVYKDSLYIPENFNIGRSASALFVKDSIIVLQGVYPVSFTHGRNGSTVVNVKSY
jgi:hypothetical protein